VSHVAILYFFYYSLSSSSFFNFQLMSSDLVELWGTIKPAYKSDYGHIFYAESTADDHFYHIYESSVNNDTTTSFTSSIFGTTEYPEVVAQFTGIKMISHPVVETPGPKMYETTYFGSNPIMDEARERPEHAEFFAKFLRIPIRKPVKN